VTQKLTALWRSADVETLETAGRKLVVISDSHLGNGGRADDLRHNEWVLVDALRRYAAEGYTLILLGDIEEFWQFDLEDIVRRYNDSVYAAIRAFEDENVHRVFGNHDREWGSLSDPARRVSRQAGYAAEAIKLKDARGETRFLLVHGHQGSIDADKYAWMSRFFVRLFKLIEPAAIRLGVYRYRWATKSQITQDFERIMYRWAKANRVILVCGHSHRAIFASRSYAERLTERIAALRAESADAPATKGEARANANVIARLKRHCQIEKKRGRVIVPVEAEGVQPLPCYFNSGCACYTDGITALEICDPEIRLVKWYRSEPATRTVYNTGLMEAMIAQVVGG
jgi:UDP-2,3-diacylglucosamine pyrophosphatase LpxH